MKKTIIVGNLGNAAECRECKGGHKFVTFNVAFEDKTVKDESGNTEKKALWAEC